MPSMAQIFAVVDVFNAVTSDRPYHNKISYEAAQKIILEGSGQHFDSCVVETFIEIPLQEWKRVDRNVSTHSMKHCFAV